MNSVLINKKKKRKKIIHIHFINLIIFFIMQLFFIFNLANLVEYVWSQSMDNKSSLRYSEESEKKVKIKSKA